MGYRDLVRFNDETVADHGPALLDLLSGQQVEAAQLKQIDDESGRYTVRPVGRIFDVPTTALIFFGPETIRRFSWERKGVSETDGVATWELEFTETARPTLFRTRDGRDVPSTGRVWVVPGDGTIVRTRLELRHFADKSWPSFGTGTRFMASSPFVPGGWVSDANGRIPELEIPVGRGSFSAYDKVESLARVEVTYRFDRSSGTWLPWKMSERWEGPMPGSTAQAPLRGGVTSVAEYRDFKRFDTSAKVVIPKQH
jgi:hypothetical protein